MTDYAIATSTRHCAVSGRELKAGERHFSALVEEGGSFVRKDYAAEAWAGSPAGVVGFWQTRVPTGSAPRRPAVDDEVLLDCLARLEGTPDEAARRFRYVLALYLLRRKRLVPEKSDPREGEVLWVKGGPRNGERFAVADPGLSDGEMESVQEDVFRVLGWQ